MSTASYSMYETCKECNTKYSSMPIKGLNWYIPYPYSYYPPDKMYYNSYISTKCNTCGAEKVNKKILFN